MSPAPPPPPPPLDEALTTLARSLPGVAEAMLVEGGAPSGVETAAAEALGRGWPAGAERWGLRLGRRTLLLTRSGAGPSRESLRALSALACAVAAPAEPDPTGWGEARGGHVLGQLTRSYPFGAIVVYDRELRYRIVGGQGLADVGLDPERMRGRLAQEVFPEVFEHLEPDYRAALRGEVRSGELAYGSERYLVMNGPIRDARGVVVAGVTITSNVTETVRMRAQLERAQALADASQRAGRVGAWSYDFASGRVEWSEPCLDLYGFSADDAPQTLDGIVADAVDEDRARVRDAVLAALEAGEGFALTYRRLIRGAARVLEVRAAVQRDADGRAVRLTGLSQDVTERDAAERARARQARELEQARARAEAGERAKSEFLATMSHELRTPLHGILGSVSLLSEESRLDLEARELLATIRRSGEQLLEVIDDVLHLSQLEQGELHLERRPFSVVHEVEHVVAGLAETAHAKGLHLDHDAAPELYRPRRGDPVRFRQAVHKLVSNAVKFTATGTVEVVCRPSEERDVVEVEVRDTGIGISEEGLTQLFRPFSQLDASRRRRFGGAGLGLALVARIAAAGGGRAWARSEPGRGSIFYLRLKLPPAGAPAVDDPLAGVRCRVEPARAPERPALARKLTGLGAEVVEPPEEAEVSLRVLPPEDDRARAIEVRGQGGAPLRLGYPLLRVPLARAVRQAYRLGRAEAYGATVRPRRLRILVAEDNPVNQKVVSRMLARLGHAVTLADDGARAVALADEQTFDVVLMDLQMPVMDGLEATRRIRRREAELGRPRLTVWALTANALTSDRAQCEAAGMDEFLTKPIRLDELGERLSGLCPPAAPAAEAPEGDQPDPSSGGGGGS